MVPEPLSVQGTGFFERLSEEPSSKVISERKGAGCRTLNPAVICLLGSVLDRHSLSFRLPKNSADFLEGALGWVVRECSLWMPGLQVEGLF